MQQQYMNYISWMFQESYYDKVEQKYYLNALQLNFLEI